MGNYERIMLNNISFEKKCVFEKCIYGIIIYYKIKIINIFKTHKSYNIDNK